MTAIWIGVGIVAGIISGVVIMAILASGSAMSRLEELLSARRALKRIADMETVNCASIGKRMAAVAKEELDVC